jgi:hypothetical protein
MSIYKNDIYYFNYIIKLLNHFIFSLFQANLARKNGVIIEM